MGYALYFLTVKNIFPGKSNALELYQKINHFPGMWNIHKKNSLASNLNKMRKNFPQEYNFFPKTWVYPDEKRAIVGYMEDKLSINSNFLTYLERDLQPLLILKPARGC